MTQMKNKKTATDGPAKFKPKKRRGSRTVLVFWICLVLLLAPVVVLGWILFSSSMNTHTPVIGNRYEGDLDPAITKTQLEQVKTAATAVEGVKDVDIEMATATLRVYANVAPESTAETETATADAIYKAVSGILDPTVYFTKTDTKKMYDMEIHVYNEAERTNQEGDNFVYVIETKTSSMSAPAAQVVSTAKDPTLAQQLRDDVTARLAEEAANSATSGTGTTPDSTADTTATDATATPAE